MPSQSSSSSLPDSPVSLRRRLLLLAGDEAAAERWIAAQPAFAQLLQANAGLLWVANSSDLTNLEPVAASRVQQHLGSEFRLLVFNAHQGFNPDAFAAAVGTLRGGGDCVLLSPDLADWPAFDDPDRRRFAAYPRSSEDMRGAFIERLLRLWNGDAAVVAPNAVATTSLQIAPRTNVSAPLLSTDQERVAAQVARVSRGHARRPLVLTADRGRGKSTLLGVSAARLLRSGLPRVTVVAPGRAAVEALFRAALLEAGLSPQAFKNPLQLGAGELCFLTPADWSQDQADAASLVVVDEAAAIPLSWLERLLQQCNRLVFASTVHGYEGSGRGFAVRFRETLDRVAPQWQAATLDAPVRWAADDPLESLLNRSLLLDAELPETDVTTSRVRSQGLSVCRVDTAVLANDERLLRELFALLVSAHYQTRPSDLRQLLDNPDVRLWLARCAGQVVGVLLAVREGGLDAPMARRIVDAERRPRGHLLAQSLAVHAGLDDCLTLPMLRVQRIAVHPNCRRQRIGSRLVDAASDWCGRNRVDLIGTAFGVEPGVLTFWRGAGFVPVRLGLKIDAASAARSLLMLRGISADGERLAAAGGRRFQVDLPWALAGPLRDLDSGIARRLLVGRPTDDITMTIAETTALARVVAGARQPETAVALVWKAVLQLAASGVGDDRDMDIAVAWFLQHRDPAEVCRCFSLAGRKALLASLRGLLAPLLEPPEISG
jgi:tRNA(Met) cytidine acetyltransferase